MSAHPDPSTMTPLKDYLASHPSAQRSLLLQQVAAQLAAYHMTTRVVHGDVKMANVQVALNGVIKLGESTKSAPISCEARASVSVLVDEHGYARLPKSRATAPVTSRPRAPANPDERLPMTTATDVYAFAWLVFHVYTDIDPHELARDPQTMRLIASGVKPNKPGPRTIPVHRGLDDPLWDVITRCWELNPALRPSMDEVLRAFDPPTAPPPGLNAEVPRIFYPADLRYFWTNIGSGPLSYALELSESLEDTVHVIPLELTSFWRV
ncbi:hypothetical protein EXIGLDRAFT_519546 [Exidia glandulosa HHB12029]|uniref:Protein kinase domain-containing protein n=1 Tax=Exidia glandulosa HHB12029 TaxID=1314781 RepID=A0A166N1B0_EXIGL|nr:hypothetical protein EXIGLDRAFT_519546 [Exidia glandulosa HHB12029]